MSGKYKCCQKLFTSYYVCTQCHEIIHRNCVTTGKYKGTLNIIKGNKVNCCTREVIDLEKSISIIEEKNTVLEETLNELSLDSNLKTKHIDKLKREHETLLNEASIREDELNKIISENENTIYELKEHIKKMKLDLSAYTNKVFSSGGTQTEMAFRNAATTTEISTPSEPSQIEPMSRTVMTSKSEAPTVPVLTRTIRSVLSVDPDQTLSQSPLCQEAEGKRKNILVLSDNFGYNVNQLLSNRLNSKDYQVQCIYKPGARFKNVIEDIENLSCNFTLNDHIVIMAGSNNFSNASDYPKCRELWNKLKLCPNTNFTFVGVPYNNDQSQNRLIYKFNKNLNRFLYKLDSCLPSFFGYIDVNVGFGTLSKKKLGNLVHDKIILGNNALPKNLILINTNQNTENTTTDNSVVNGNVTKVLAPNVIETNISPIENSLLNVQRNFLYPRLSQMSQI